jgi:cell division transport system permease protein
MTLMVIGITLALPLGLYVLDKNLREVMRRWGSDPQATVFVSPDVQHADVEALIQQLWLDPRFRKVEFVDRNSALEDFTAASGLDAVLGSLSENPLPDVLVLTLDPRGIADADDRELAHYLDDLKATGDVSLDVLWIRRLQALGETASRMLFSVAAFLCFGVVLIIGNVVRGEVQNRRDEIEVARLFGATNVFVRRPLLYHGAIQGALGGALACVAVTICVAALSKPMKTLATLFGNEAGTLSALNSAMVVSVILAGGLFGLLGAWIAVHAYLNRLDAEDMA